MHFTICRLNFILSKSKALYPSIYLYKKSEENENFRYIHAVLKEAKRVSSQFTPKKPIFAFTRVEYQPYENPTYYYSEVDNSD